MRLSNKKHKHFSQFLNPPPCSSQGFLKDEDKVYIHRFSQITQILKAEFEIFGSNQISSPFFKASFLPVNLFLTPKAPWLL